MEENMRVTFEIKATLDMNQADLNSVVLRLATLQPIIQRKFQEEFDAEIYNQNIDSAILILQNMKIKKITNY